MPGDPFPAPAPDGQSHIERVPALPGLASVWVQQVGRDAAPYAHRRIRHGAAELVCRVGAAPRVIGPLTGPLVEVLEPGTTVVGLRFRPGAFPAGGPASELVGIQVDAAELWGRSAVALGEAVATAASPAEALVALQLQVRKRPGDPLVAEAVRGLRPGGAAGVTTLSASLHISETQLRRRFRAAVGLGPKTLHRILRFQGFLALVQRAIAQGRADDGLGLLALRAGYADQPHLTRECVRLTGVTPRVFLTETRRLCGRTHDHAASYTALLRASSG